jgi:SAM-dependent methyltransferase
MAAEPDAKLGGPGAELGGPGAELAVADAALEDAPCPMGCARDDEQLFVGRDRFYGRPGAFPVVRCRTCQLVRSNPRPTMETIGSYYPDLYGPYHRAENRPKPVAVGRAALVERWARHLRLDGTRELLPPHLPPGRALEVGCASGGFLLKLARRGWQVEGIEPSASAAERAIAQGLAVHVGPIETAPDRDRKLDLIVASHSLEHLHQPLASMRRLRAWARPGALLSCAIPDAGGFLFRRFGAAWYDADLPRHLFHFTPRTFTNLLSAAGWKVERVRGQRTLNCLMGSIGNALRDRKGAGARRLGDAFLHFPESRAPWKPLLMPLTLALAALRQTGRMKIWARAV